MPYHCDQAFVLAAGFGTRLGTMTADRPKAMVEANGHTLLEHTIARLASQGIRKFVVNTHWFAESIRDVLPIYAGQYDVTIIESYEPEILGTGGAIAAAADYLDHAPFWIANVDVVTDFDLRSMPLDRSAAGALVLRRDETARDKGSFSIRGNTITRMLTVGPDQGEAFMFTGLHWLNDNVYAYTKPEFGSIFAQYYLPAMRNNLMFDAHIHDGFWVDAGTPEGLQKAAEFLQN